MLIDFWTYSCINCLRTLPHLKSWHEKYSDEGLVIVGVHTPEFAFERVRDNVQGAIDDLGIEYPVALDPNFGTWRAWGNRYWPAKYFIDAEGRVRHGHFGEGAYEESEEVIRGLLREAGNLGSLDDLASAGIADRTPTSAQTPEIYLGHVRIEHYVGDALQPDTPTEYEAGEALEEGTVTLDGNWTVEPERSVAGPSTDEAAASVRIRFVGRCRASRDGPRRAGWRHRRRPHRRRARADDRNRQPPPVHAGRGVSRQLQAARAPVQPRCVCLRVYVRQDATARLKRPGRNRVGYLRGALASANR